MPSHHEAQQCTGLVSGEGGQCTVRAISWTDRNCAVANNVKHLIVTGVTVLPAKTSHLYEEARLQPHLCVSTFAVLWTDRRVPSGISDKMFVKNRLKEFLKPKSTVGQESFKSKKG